MAHEKVMFLVSRISKKTLKNTGWFVFRTRAKARKFAKDKETRFTRYHVVNKRAVWGPDNV